MRRVAEAPLPRRTGSEIRRPSPTPALDPSVRALGVVTLLSDFSSEITVRTLPLFLVNVLGAKTGVVGLIEGIAESTSTLLKLVSGVLSDRFEQKKPLTLWGYGLSGFTKPLLYFATSWWWVLAVRFLDRAGKGIRTSPRDAIIAELTPPEHRGRAFGFNKAMDKLGAVTALLCAALLLLVGQHGAVGLTRRSYQWLVLLALVPGIASVIVLALAVRESAPALKAKALKQRPSWRDARGPFPQYLAVLFCFSLGNSSDAFLMLRAQSVGLSTVTIFIILAVFNLVIVASSIPAGVLSDRLGRRHVMVVGWVIYAAVYFGFAFASQAWHVWALYAGYGLYHGAFQGASTALVADLVPAERRGTAFGLYNAATGAAALPASLMAGWLWQTFGQGMPFLVGGGLALIAAVWLGLLGLRRSTPVPAGE